MTADVETRTRLRCDQPGCRMTFPAKGDPQLFAGHTYARRLASEVGWTYQTMRGDFCPEHKEQP